MKITTKWRWVIAVLAFVFASEFLVGKYFPWFKAQAWYLRHWKGVTFMGKVIPVPRGMMGSERTPPGETIVTFDKFPPTLHQGSMRSLWGISFAPDLLPHKTPQEAVRRLGMDLQMIAARTGGSVGPPFAVDTQAGKGWCYRMTFPRRNDVITKCLLFNAEWDAMYKGPPDHEKDFFKVIAGIHDHGKQNAPM